MNVDTGEVDGGLVTRFDNYNTINCPWGKEVDDNGLVNLIVYPVPSYESRVQGVVVVLIVLIPLLQLLVMTAVFNMIGLGTNRLKEPPASISLSTVYLSWYVTDC